MNRPWEAEQTVDAAAARALIARQFPALAAAAVEPFGVGWDNTAFLVGGRWVFRFPRRAIAVPLLTTECAVLPALASRLPLPVPVPIYLGQPDGDYPWPFAGYVHLAGQTACRAGLDAAQRTAAAVPVARFLAALHAVPAAEARGFGAGPDTLARLDMTRRALTVTERLARLRELGLVDDVRPLQRLLDATPTGWTPEHETLAHGDLYSRHLLVDAAGRPCGVIDWGDVHLGDAAVDLAIAHCLLPPSAHDAFRAAYGAIDETRWLVARCRALFSAVAIVLYGHDVGDAALVREGRIGLGFLRNAG